MSVLDRLMGAVERLAGRVAAVEESLETGAIGSHRIWIRNRAGNTSAIIFGVGSVDDPASQDRIEIVRRPGQSSRMVFLPADGGETQGLRVYHPGELVLSPETDWYGTEFRIVDATTGLPVPVSRLVIVRGGAWLRPTTDYTLTEGGTLVTFTAVLGEAGDGTTEAAIEDSVWIATADALTA